MTPVAAYLNFDGDCREAMTFYRDALGGELETMDFAQGEFEVPPEAADRVLHACLTGDGFMLMASDTMPGAPHVVGTNVSLYLSCGSEAQVAARFAALAAGGTSTMPPAPVFWGAYFGMLVDRFGISWMLSHDTPREVADVHPAREPAAAG
jgi:PhnB protein